MDVIILSPFSLNLESRELEVKIAPMFFFLSSRENFNYLWANIVRES